MKSLTWALRLSLMSAFLILSLAPQANAVRWCPARSFFKTVFSRDEVKLTLRLANKRGISSHFIQSGAIQKQVEHFKARFPEMKYSDFLHSDPLIRKEAIIQLNDSLFRETKALLKTPTTEEIAFLKKNQNKIQEAILKEQKSRIFDPSLKKLDELTSDLNRAYQTKDFSHLKVLTREDGNQWVSNDNGILLEVIHRKDKIWLQTLDPEVFEKRVRHLQYKDVSAENFRKRGFYLPWFDSLSLSDFTRNSSGIDFMPLGILKPNELAYADNSSLNVFSFFHHDYFHGTDTMTWYAPFKKKLRKSFIQAIEGKSEDFTDAFDRLVFYSSHENPEHLVQYLSQGSKPDWKDIKNKIVTRSTLGDFGLPRGSVPELSHSLDEAIKIYERILKKHQIIK